MSDNKDDKTGELEDEQLSEVTGGAGVGSPAQPPGALTEAEGIASPRDPASGNKTNFNDFNFTHKYDKSSP